MKVFQINTVCGITSTGRICTDIAYELQSKKHECKIAYGRGFVPTEHKKNAIKIGNAFGYHVHAFLTRIFDTAGFHSSFATRKLIKQIEEYNPDIIHLHNLHGYYINIKMLFDFLKKNDKPVVWTLHDCWAFTGHCVHFEIANCKKWKEGGCKHCIQKKKYPSSFFFDRSMKNFAAKKDIFCGVKNMTIVTPSKWLESLVKESFLKEYPVKVIPNGINTDFFKPTQSNFRKKHNIENKKIILGVANGWGKSKGLYDFIELSKILDNTYKIVLVGLKENQLNELPASILGITKTHNVQELAEIYTAADIFVNPTHQDNYPTVNLESQACGTPVITYKTGGSIESVTADGIVPKGDISALAERLKTSFPPCRTDLLYDKKNMAFAYYNIYKHICNN